MTELETALEIARKAIESAQRIAAASRSGKVLTVPKKLHADILKLDFERAVELVRGLASDEDPRGNALEKQALRMLLRELDITAQFDLPPDSARRVR